MSDPRLAQTRDGYVRILERRQSAIAGFEIREVGDAASGDLRFRGYACVVGVTYEMEDSYGPWIESVERGAFRKTLAEKPDVAFLVNHEGMSLARTASGTLTLTEDTRGLLAEARLDPQNPQVVALRSAIDRGDISEMSFGFWVVRQEWNEDYTRRWIREVELSHGDVSPVNFAANPATGGTVTMRMRSTGAPRRPESKTRRDVLKRHAALMRARLELELVATSQGSRATRR